MVYVNMVNIGKYTASIINALQQQSSAYLMIIAYRQTYSHNCFVRWQWPVLALLKTHNLDVSYLT